MNKSSTNSTKMYVLAYRMQSVIQESSKYVLLQVVAGRLGTTHTSHNDKNQKLTASYQTFLEKVLEESLSHSVLCVVQITIRSCNPYRRATCIVSLYKMVVRINLFLQSFGKWDIAMYSWCATRLDDWK